MILIRKWNLFQFLAAGETSITNFSCIRCFRQKLWYPVPQLSCNKVKKNFRELVTLKTMGRCFLQRFHLQQLPSTAVNSWQLHTCQTNLIWGIFQWVIGLGLKRVKTNYLLVFLLSRSLMFCLKNHFTSRLQYMNSPLQWIHFDKRYKQ